ncbi:MAG: protease complex subunit PrcB family protein [Ezakiella sp.]|nr:protease complex subunit PrcB family protein [Ezakiella sp.]
MKKLITLSIIILLLTTSIFAEEVDVTDFKQSVLIDDMVFDLPSIVYKNENYIKLRDFARLLSYMEDGGFKILYDNKTKRISCITSYPYEPIGTELTPLGTITKAEISNAKLDIDNVDQDLDALLFGGHNYFKLKNLLDAFKINWEYDLENKTIHLSKKEVVDMSVKAGDALGYRRVDTENKLKEEGFIYTTNKENNSITLTFAKKFNTGGYQIRCERVYYDGKNIVVKPLVISPAKDAMVTQAITYPNCSIEINIEGVPEGYGVIVEGIETNASTM